MDITEAAKYFVLRESTEQYDINSLTGRFMAVYSDDRQPVLLSNGKDKKWLLPVFTTPDKLSEAMKWIKPCNRWKIQQITDGPDWFDSVTHPDILVAVDPWITEAGNTRFFGVVVYK